MEGIADGSVMVAVCIVNDGTAVADFAECDNDENEVEEVRRVVSPI